MKSTYRYIFLLLLSVFVTGRLVAQDTLSPGFTIATGGGFSVLKGICAVCGDNGKIQPGYSWSIAPQITLTRKLSMQAVFYTAKMQKTRFGSGSRSMLLLGLVYSPDDKGPWSFQAGGGWGNSFFVPSSPLTINDSVATLGSVNGFGFAAAAGVLYNRKLNGRFSLQPMLGFYSVFPGDLLANNRYVLHDTKPAAGAALSVLIRISQVKWTKRPV